MAHSLRQPGGLGRLPFSQEKRETWPDFKRVDGRGDLWISGRGNPDWILEKNAQGELAGHWLLGDSIANGIQAKGDGLVNDFPGKVLSKV